MDERSDQILNQIEDQRNRLGQNLNELENRVRSTADWRAQFEKNPALMLGVALGGGILLGAMVGGGSSRHGRRGYPASGRSKSTPAYRSAPDLAAGSSMGFAAVESDYSTTEMESSGESTHMPSTTEHRYSGKPRQESRAVAHQKERAAYTLDNIKAALIAFGIDKAKEFLSAALPGFDRHMAEADQENRGEGQSSDTSATYSQESGYTEQQGNRIFRPGEENTYSSETRRVYTPGHESSYSGGSTSYESGYRGGSQ